MCLCMSMHMCAQVLEDTLECPKPRVTDGLTRVLGTQGWSCAREAGAVPSLQTLDSFLWFILRQSLTR